VPAVSSCDTNLSISILEESVQSSRKFPEVTITLTIRSALLQAAAELESAEVPSPNPRLDAEMLLLFTLGREGDRAYLLAHSGDELESAAHHRFQDLLQQRLAGKPIQYITGHQEFFGLDFRVTPDVLIPRPETEHLVETALDLCCIDLCGTDSQSVQTIFGDRRSATGDHLRILDVGTGSGCIAVALAHSLPQAQVTAVDVSPAALMVARRNAELNRVRVEFLESDLLSAVSARRFELIVSNPPYIGTDNPDTVQRQVRDFEPSLALWGGQDGLSIYQRLIPQAHAALSEGGYLLLEIGYSLEAAVRALFCESLWQNVQTIHDLQGLPRVIFGRKK
jgi:release factor glutamine methyltransferase